jgi:mannose-6-phosphate isomerase-like protein (cupin superfamily)
MFEKEEFLLYEGDSVRILPAMKHRFRNETSKDIKVLFVKNNPF